MANTASAATQRPRWQPAARWLAVFGPGLVVMLADTDVGSLVTAGQSGAQWGYRLLLIQVLLMPILYHHAGADGAAWHPHRAAAMAS